MSVRFTIAGSIPSKKNRWSVGKGGQVYIPGDVKKELDDFLWQIKSAKNRNRIAKPLEGKLKIELAFHGKENFKKDLDNMSTTVFDLLQKGEIIKNDKDIVEMFTTKEIEGENSCEVILKEQS